MVQFFSTIFMVGNRLAVRVGLVRPRAPTHVHYNLAQYMQTSLKRHSGLKGVQQAGFAKVNSKVATVLGPGVVVAHRVTPYTSIRNCLCDLKR